VLAELGLALDQGTAETEIRDEGDQREAEGRDPVDAEDLRTQFAGQIDPHAQLHEHHHDLTPLHGHDALADLRFHGLVHVLIFPAQGGDLRDGAERLISEDGSPSGPVELDP